MLFTIMDTQPIMVSMDFTDIMPMLMDTMQYTAQQAMLNTLYMTPLLTMLMLLPAPGEIVDQTGPVKLMLRMVQTGTRLLTHTVR